MNILVIVSLVIILGSSFSGYRKGFLRTALTMSSFIIAMILVTMINPVVTTYVKEHTRLEETIQESISNLLIQEGESDLEEKFFADFGEGPALPKAWEEALGKLSTEELYEQLGVEEILAYYTEYYTNMAVRAVSYLISVVIAYLIIRLCIGVADIIGYIPVLSGLNRLAGLLLGMARGVVILWLAGLVVAACTGYEWTAPVLDMIKESSLLTFLYRNNLLARIILPVMSAFF